MPPPPSYTATKRFPFILGLLDVPTAGRYSAGEMVMRAIQDLHAERHITMFDGRVQSDA